MQSFPRGSRLCELKQTRDWLSLQEHVNVKFACVVESGAIPEFAWGPEKNHEKRLTG